MSSANQILDDNFQTLGRSFIEIRNEKGPKIDPCGTPNSRRSYKKRKCLALNP